MMKAPLSAEQLLYRCLSFFRSAASRTAGAFSAWARKVSLTLCQVFFKYFEIYLISQESHYKSVENLIRIGADIREGSDSSIERGLRTIVIEAGMLVNASSCNLYLLDKYGETMRLKITTDPNREKELQLGKDVLYKRGEGLTGWIFKTGKPLLLNDTACFINKKELSDQELQQYSDSVVINDEDRVVQAMEAEVYLDATEFSHFLGVPVLSSEGKTQGVLEVLSHANKRAFTRRDFKLLQDFANNISALLAEIRQQDVNRTLIEIGQEYGRNLFQYVVNEIPALVLARGCSIFLKSDKDNFFRLAYTNSPFLMENHKTKKVQDIYYQPGIGKTGLVAKLGRSLIINHYGPGNLDYHRLLGDEKRYRDDEKYRYSNLVGVLRDETGRQVGLARLIRNRTEQPFTETERNEFEQFIAKIQFTEKGLTSHEEARRCEEGEGGFAKSFLACSLKDSQKQDNIYGVMRMPRSFSGGIFTDDDLDLIVSVTNRLSAVIEMEKTLEQNLTLLSRINAKINSSFVTQAHVDELLRTILEAVTDTLGFEFAAINLVNSTHDTISTVMGMKNKDLPDAIDPTQWVGASHPLDPPEGKKRDIHAWLLREHRQHKIIKGWDEHFDLEIYTTYGHEKLIRVFVPIVAQNPNANIGTIEAGYYIERKSFIEDKQVTILKALADQAAIAIRNRDLQDKLIKAERLHFVPDMAHILKSPAIDIDTNLQLIQRELKKADADRSIEIGLDLNRLQRYVDLIKRANSTSLMMSHALYVEMGGLVRPQKKESIELIGFLHTLTQSILYYGERVRVGTLLQSSCPLLLTETERTWLGIMLFNLIDNGIKYSSPDDPVLVVCYKDNGDVYISVIDHGPGISPEDRDLIFKPGFSKPGPGWPQSTGMGLYTVQRLSDKLGWSCEVSNETAGGAKFVIQIPAKCEETL